MTSFTQKGNVLALQTLEAKKDVTERAYYSTKSYFGCFTTTVASTYSIAVC